jgi:hypothetical protein
MRRLFRSAFKPVATTLALMLALLSLQSNILAQQTGQITGTVLDATGAAIPNAKVVLTDEATKATRQTTSNGVGFFSFSAVMPANYDLKVEAKGFKSWSVAGIHMSPGDKRDIAKVELAVGAAAESVSVEATATGVDVVSSPEKSSTITANDIERQSIQGRNALELLRILPGMSARAVNMDNKPGYDPTAQNIWNSPTGNYGMNGMSPQMGGSSVSSDGAQIIDPGDMGANIATVNMDMVSEVKVQTSNFSADTNRGPVVINAVGKSGASQYHGAGYLYARNGILNSNDWFNNSQNIPKPEDHYYYPGGSFGGPVKIPGTNLDKKMFFFAGFEYYAQVIPQSAIRASVPTDGMRAGDFSWNSMASLCGPQMPTGWQPFSENPNVANVSKGPAYCVTPTVWYDVQDQSKAAVPIVNGQIQQFINPAGQAYMNLFPHANATPTAVNNWSNYVHAYSNNYDSWQLHPRVDYNFNDNNKLYVTYNRQKEMDPVAQQLFWAPSNAMLYPGNVQTKMTSNAVSVNFTRVFSPSLTSETIAAVTWYTGPAVLTNPSAVSRNGLDFPSVFDNGVDQVPTMWSWWPGGMPALSMQSGFIDNQQPMRKTDYNVQENITKVFATHTLKVGGNYERSANTQSMYANTAGTMGFSPNPWQWVWSGPAGNYSGWQGCGGSTPACFNNVADLLMGWPDSFSQDQKALSANVFYKTFGFFVTDNWKATKRLTLDLGVRFDHLTPWTDGHGIGAAVFDPALYAQQVTVDAANFSTSSTVQYPGMKWHAIDHSIPVAGSPTRWGFISPRVGMAWDILGTGKWVLRGGWGSYRWHDNVQSGALTPGMGQLSYNSGAPYGGWNFDMIRSAMNSNVSQLFGDSGASFVSSTDDQHPLTNNWNFTLSHPTVWNSFLEISYVGNETSHMLNPGKTRSINLIPIGGYYSKAFPTAALDSNTHQANISGLSSAAVVDWYRPYTWYNDQLYGSARKAWANYNSLQVAWNKTRGWATFGLNYTFSKALGIYTDADPFNLQNDYGPLNIDRTHIVNASYSFDLGTRVRGDFTGSWLVKGLANGWQFSGITQWSSGAPLTAISSSNLGFGGYNAVQNTYNYNASGVVEDHIPNQLLTTVQMNNSNMLGTPDVALQPYVMPGCDPTAKNGNENSYFNTACWVVPDFMHNGPVYKGYFHSPAYFNSDLSVFKDFRLGEKRKLQFRISGFNFLNHPLVSFLSSDWSSMSLANLQSPSGGFAPGQRIAPSDFTYNQNGDPNFVGTPHSKFGRRVVQLALKFEF